MSDDLIISLDDLQQHIVKYGFDIYPPIDVRNEVTRTHDLFQALQERWPKIYQELSFRPQSGEFKVGASFEFHEQTIKFATLVLTQRGPVFGFPIRLPDPLGGHEHEEQLDELVLASLGLIRKTFPRFDVLRVGLVRETMFGTGQSDSAPYLTNRFGVFPGTVAQGGKALLTFHDDTCNVRVTIDTVQIQRKSQMKAGGRVLSEESSYGLKVDLDVNNKEMRPQETSEIEMVIQRAHSLWPKEMLDFINWKGDTR